MSLACIAALLIGAQGWGQSQTESTPRNSDVKSKIDQLKSRLRWSDENSQNKYRANRVQVTNEIWTLIDSFVAQTYSGNINPEQLRTTLDSMLGNKSDDLDSTVVLPVDIPAGKFVIAGLEVTRGGHAISEDAISFRAYGKVASRWTLVSHVELEPEDDFLVDLNALALPQGFPGTFGLIAWAMEPPITPYKTIARVYAFDGERFTTVWAPQSFVTGNVSSFVTLTSTGFDLHTRASNRVTDILQSYTVASGEVIKSSEVQEPQ